jgi:cytochrome P450
MSATPHLPPGPRFAPLQTFRYMRDPYAYYEWACARWGDLFTFPAMNGTLVVTCTPEGTAEILAGRESDFVVGFGVDAVQPIIGAGSLLLLSGERHQRERKVLSPAFHGARMRAYAPFVAESALRALDSWHTGQRINALEAMQSISLEVIIRTVFGIQAQERVTAVAEAIQRAVGEINPAPIFFKALQREFGGFGPWARFLRRMRILDGLIFAQIAESRRRDADADDVLHALLRLRYEDGSALDDQAVRDHLLTLLVAGHETTATTLAWALYEQARHPQIRDRLVGELEELGPDPDPAEVAKLPYLEAFCRETLRMHPVLAEFMRTVRDRFTLQGYEIPAGVTVATSILMLHRRPDLYPEPERFRPERFLERKFAPNEFATFGGGHRHCLGAAFAMNELKVVLGTLLPRVELSLAVDRPLRPVRRNATLAPEAGVPLVVGRKRSGGAAVAA